jgi:ABC-type glycerol-3-phosphate transport system substrate-binding protein
MMRIMTRALLLLVAAVGLAGCGVVAAPVRATSAVVKVVPAAGDVVAKPLDVTADVID